MREVQSAASSEAIANDNCQMLICHDRDRVAVDAEAGHVYWGNTGLPDLNDGSIERADIDGRNRTTIIPAGVTVAPARLQLDKASGKLYWSDREGMRVMCSNLDGSHIETLIETRDKPNRSASSLS